MKTTQYAEVFQARGSWHVRFTSEPRKSEVIELFGTATLPTPYTSAMTFEQVVARLRAIDANANVAFVEAK